ncbi:MAG: hypothetical protein SGI89_10775 [bacterium]|nr:hypothetical protein [bacterium]
MIIREIRGKFYNVIILMMWLGRRFNINFERIPVYVYAAACAVIIIFLFRTNNVKTAMLI